MIEESKKVTITTEEETVEVSPNVDGDRVFITIDKEGHIKSTTSKETIELLPDVKGDGKIFLTIENKSKYDDMSRDELIEELTNRDNEAEYLSLKETILRDKVQISTNIECIGGWMVHKDYNALNKIVESISTFSENLQRYIALAQTMDPSEENYN